MANDEHVQLLLEDVAGWNRWREENREVRANLQWANLTDADLRGADLQGADLRDVNITEADLSEADLCEADISDDYITLSGANFEEAASI